MQLSGIDRRFVLGKDQQYLKVQQVNIINRIDLERNSDHRLRGTHASYARAVSRLGQQRNHRHLWNKGNSVCHLESSQGLYHVSRFWQSFMREIFKIMFITSHNNYTFCVQLRTYHIVKCQSPDLKKFFHTLFFKTEAVFFLWFHYCICICSGDFLRIDNMEALRTRSGTEYTRNSTFSSANEQSHLSSNSHA